MMSSLYKVIVKNLMQEDLKRGKQEIQNIIMKLLKINNVKKLKLKKNLYLLSIKNNIQMY